MAHQQLKHFPPEIMLENTLSKEKVRAINSLRNFNENELAEFLGFMEIIVCPQNTLLFNEAEPGDSMYLIVENAVSGRRIRGYRVFPRDETNGQRFGGHRSPAGHDYPPVLGQTLRRAIQTGRAVLTCPGQFAGPNLQEL